jgi:asparagine synthase (glutamine-hydrolysing)
MKTKYLLKKAAEGLVPAAVIHRQKKGFGVPLSKRLTGKLKEFMSDYLSEERIRIQGIFNYSYVKCIIEEQLTRKKNNREMLRTLLVFQTWHERYIEGNEI